MILEYYIALLEQSYPNKCLILTDSNLEKPGPTILWASKPMLDLVGYTLDELKSESPRKFQGPKTDRRVLDRLKETLKSGKIFEGEILNYHKDGTEFIKAWRIEPLMDPLGHIMFYFAVNQDMKMDNSVEGYIAAMKQIRDTQEEIVEKLKRVDKSLDREISVLSAPGPLPPQSVYLSFPPTK